jgi:hypothetical protein
VPYAELKSIPDPQFGTMLPVIFARSNFLAFVEEELLNSQLFPQSDEDAVLAVSEHTAGGEPLT